MIDVPNLRMPVKISGEYYSSYVLRIFGFMFVVWDLGVGVQLVLLSACACEAFNSSLEMSEKSIN